MWRLSENRDWEYLRNKFSWINDMHGVLQDPIHHAEGDVAIHTKMVSDEMLKICDHPYLEEQYKEMMFIAALMHDIEKRSTTKEENGRIVSPGHAKKGAMTARQLLYTEYNAPFEIREKIVGLVRHHGLPLWVMEKPDPTMSIIKASYEVCNNDLYKIALADIRGRYCSDVDDLMYRLEMFDILAGDNLVHLDEYRFANAHSKFKYFYTNGASGPSYNAFDDTKTKVVLMSGIAGSGKDHYIKNHLGDYKMVSLDDIRRKNGVKYGDTKGNGQAVQEAKELAKSYMRAGIPMVWNGTNITRQMREQLIDLFATYNAEVTIVYCEVPYKTLLKQNLDREHPIPTAAIDKMVHSLEVPKGWEAHNLILNV